MAKTKKTVRVIKRYPNRKLYDTETSSYITIEYLAELVRRGASIKVIETKTKKDITSTTLAAIILETERKSTRTGSARVLESIIKRGSIVEFLTDETPVKTQKGIELDYSELTKKIEKEFGKLLGLDGIKKLVNIVDEYLNFTISKVKSELERKRKLDARKLISLKKELIDLKEELKILRKGRFYDD